MNSSVSGTKQSREVFLGFLLINFSPNVTIAILERERKVWHQCTVEDAG